MTNKRRKISLTRALPDPEARVFYRMILKASQGDLPIVIPTLGFGYNSVLDACKEFVEQHIDLFFTLSHNKCGQIWVVLKKR